jgi:hypothetical protein
MMTASPFFLSAKDMTYRFRVSSKYGDSDTFRFSTGSSGTVSVSASWKGNTGDLTLLLFEPGSRAPVVKRAGNSPLRFTHKIGKSGQWRITVANYSRKGSASGVVKVSVSSSTMSSSKTIRKSATGSTVRRTTTTTGPRMVNTKVLKLQPQLYLKGLNLKSKYKLKRNYSNVKKLDFVHYQNAQPMRFTQFKSRFPVIGQLKTVKIKPQMLKAIGLTFFPIYSKARYPNGKVVVAVNSTLYPQVSSSISRYVSDIATQGYYGVVHTVSSSGSPGQLRNYLKGVTDIAGVVMVGQLPVAWYEHNQDYCGDNNNCHAEWPCDLYYMDLNGNWGDADHDGMFDSHTGHTKPDIFLGRLAAYTLPGNEADLVNKYFQKNHRFRTGDAGFSARGVTFVDDDWNGWGKCSMDLHLSIVDSYTAKDYTNSVNYKDKLKKRLAWMQLCCHSWPGGHHFKKPGGDGGYVYSDDLKNTNFPQAFFHNLFCCSSANFTVNNYQAGWYTFGNSYGLSTIGSSKTGSMLYFEYFYGALKEGMTIGEAMVAWWDALYPYDKTDRSWHYGMTIIGDPLLNWRVGAIPTGRMPATGAKLNLPATVTLKWKPIQNFGSVKYKVMAEYWNTAKKRWMLQGGTDTTKSSISLKWNKTKYRWRVKAFVYGKWGPWSPWEYVQPGLGVKTMQQIKTYQKMKIKKN